MTTKEFLQIMGCIALFALNVILIGALIVVAA